MPPGTCSAQSEVRERGARSRCIVGQAACFRLHSLLLAALCEIRTTCPTRQGGTSRGRQSARAESAPQSKMAARMRGGAAGGSENRLVSLPLSRIRVIMKSSPEVSSINPDAIFLTAKATELFVQYLVAHSYKHGQGKENKALTYNDLSHTAEKSETFQFLADILPKKILASKYLKMLEREKGEQEEQEERESENESEDEAS